MSYTYRDPLQHPLAKYVWRLTRDGWCVTLLDMAQEPLRITLDTLRSEREGAERDAVELEQKLKAVGQRLTHLRGAIENIEALLGVPSVEDEEIVAEAVDEDYNFTPKAEREPGFTPDGPSTTLSNGAEVTFGTYEPPARKRVPSTDWVAEVVERIGRPADRDTIFEAFGEIKGFPESWTNPRNSVNNALGRAVERRMVMKLEENLFAPMGYNPFEDEADDREES